MNIPIGNLKPKDAVCTKIGVRDWDENPICASMPLYSRAQLGEMLNFTPEYGEADRKLPHHIRKLMCERVRNAFICIHRSLDTAESFQTLMKSSNLSRNPYDDAFWGWRQKIIDLLRTAGEEHKISLKKCDISNLVSTVTCEESPSMSLWGAPATGKSGIILKLLLTLYRDRLLVHKREDGETFKHVPFLYLHNTVATSAKQAVISLLIQLGTIIGVDLVSKIKKYTRENIEDFALPELINYMFVYNVSAVIMDEVEMIKAAFSRGDESLRNFWLLLMNCRIPLVLIGNPDARDLFAESFKLRHRMCGMTTVIYDRLPTDGRGEWRFFLDELWPVQFTNVETLLTEDLVQAMYRHSQGFIKVTMRLYVWVQRLAITKGEMGDSEAITTELIEEAARLNAKTIEEIMTGLDSKDEKFVLPPDLQMGDLTNTIENAKTDAGSAQSDHNEQAAAGESQIGAPTKKRRARLRAGKVVPRRMRDCHKPRYKGDHPSYNGYKRLGKTRKVT
jgi:hypothetical protein